MDSYPTFIKGATSEQKKTEKLAPGSNGFRLCHCHLVSGKVYILLKLQLSKTQNSVVAISIVKYSSSPNVFFHLTPSH